MNSVTNTKHNEGETANIIEKQTAKFPSDILRESSVNSKCSKLPNLYYRLEFQCESRNVKSKGKSYSLVYILQKSLQPIVQKYGII